MPDFAHECHDPPAQRDLDADVAEQEERRYPRHACGWLLEERLCQARLLSAMCGLGFVVCSAVSIAGGFPECGGEGKEFDARETDLKTSAQLLN